MSVVRVQLRGDTAANWTSANPVLAAREFAIETDTDKYKIGDGTTAWNSLGYSSLPSNAYIVGGALGTPSSATLTNATGLPVSTGISGLGTGVATFLATPSSANLASAVTGETGSGALVFGTSPTITAPLIGRDDSTNEGGQIDFARATDNAIGWSIDAYGNTTTPDLRFVQNGSSVAFSINASRQLAGASLLSPNMIASTETTNIVGSAFAGGTVDVLTASVWWYNSNASSSGTLNIRGNSSTTLNSLLSTGQSMTVAVIIQNGATAYYPSAFQVDGSSVTPKWSGGTAPTAGNATSNDVYTYTITKTANATFTVWAAQTKFSA